MPATNNSNSSINAPEPRAVNCADALRLSAKPGVNFPE